MGIVDKSVTHHMERDPALGWGLTWHFAINDDPAIDYLPFKSDVMAQPASPATIPSRWLPAILMSCITLTLLSGCSPKTIRLTGVVWRVSGNQMPSPDMPTPSFAGYATRVYFFAPTRLKDARRAGPGGFYSNIPSPLVAQATTDAKGRFRIRLAPGRYSMFIGKDSLYYANIFDGDGFLNPVVIARDGKRRIELKADWDARY
jgi:hypothetical protein